MINHLSFNVFIDSIDGRKFEIQMTENYEDDKYHTVIFERNSVPNEWVDTINVKSEKQFFQILRDVEKGKV